MAPVEVGTVDALLRLAGVPETRRPTLDEWARRAATHYLDGLTLFQDAIGGTTPR